MSINVTDFEDARHFFDCVRDASVEAERTRLTIMRMESSEGVRAQGYQPSVRGHCPDRTDATDARIDYEARMRERIAYDYELIDLAVSVLYGRDAGRGGVESLMGSAVADCMSFRYVDARPWSEVATLAGYSPSECRRKCMEGMDAVDALGLERCVAGCGTAEG